MDMNVVREQWRKPFVPGENPAPVLLFAPQIPRVRALSSNAGLCDEKPLTVPGTTQPVGRNARCNRLRSAEIFDESETSKMVKGVVRAVRPIDTYTPNILTPFPQICRR